MATNRAACSLPPCNACHGDQSGGPVDAPRLTHQSMQYLQTQLPRMRSVAEKLKLEEIDGLAAFYSTTSAY